MSENLLCPDCLDKDDMMKQLTERNAIHGLMVCDTCGQSSDVHDDSHDPVWKCCKCNEDV